MTAEERTRLYCVFKACPQCGAHRGEYCVNNGKPWKKGYHWMRGPFAARPRFGPGGREKYRARYEKLKAQITANGDVGRKQGKSMESMTLPSTQTTLHEDERERRHRATTSMPDTPHDTDGVPPGLDLELTGQQGLLRFTGIFFPQPELGSVTFTRPVTILFAAKETYVALDATRGNLYVVDRATGVSLGCRMKAEFTPAV